MEASLGPLGASRGQEPMRAGGQRLCPRESRLFRAARRPFGSAVPEGTGPRTVVPRRSLFGGLVAPVEGHADAALETADIAVTADDLSFLPSVRGLNIGPAVALQDASTLLVVGNALGLLRYAPSWGRWWNVQPLGRLAPPDTNRGQSRTPLLRFACVWKVLLFAINPS